MSTRTTQLDFSMQRTLYFPRQKTATATACALLLAGGAYVVLKHSSHSFPSSAFTQQVNTNLPGFDFGEEMKAKVPGATLPVEATEFLVSQKDLPGISKGDHVAFRLPGSSVETNGAFRSDFAGAIRYPLTVTVDAAVNDEGFLLHYQLERASPNGPWQLKRAWRTDPAGHLLQEYPVR